MNRPFTFDQGVEAGGVHERHRRCVDDQMGELAVNELLEGFSHFGNGGQIDLAGHSKQSTTLVVVYFKNLYL